MTKNPACHWINNEWVYSNVVREAINPATYEVIGTYYDGSDTEALLAIAAARHAFETTSWRHDKNLRANVIEKIAQRFEQNTESLINLLSTENGKLTSEARFEITMIPSKLRYYGALARAEKGESGTPLPGTLSITLKEPVGVAGIIVPWNSPAVLAIRSLAPALAAGCTCVVKMPGQTALTNSMIAHILSQVDELPAGVINIFNEFGSVGAQTVVASTDTHVISFTGSTKTGAIIAAQAGKLFKRCGLELGGKSPHLIFNDAHYTKMLPILQRTATVFAGQFCMAGSRFIVHQDVVDRLSKDIANYFSTIKLGPASDPASEMGPLIDKENVVRVDRLVEEAITQGAEVIVRGGPVKQGALAKGAFYMPTLLKVSDPNMTIVQEETFGPVITIQTFKTEEEALTLANNSRYGLAASVWTQDVHLAFRVSKALQSGTVWINDWAKVYDEFEEGGYKSSGIGRLNGPSAIDEFLEIKHITLTT